MHATVNSCPEENRSLQRLNSPTHFAHLVLFQGLLLLHMLPPVHFGDQNYSLVSVLLPFLNRTSHCTCPGDLHQQVRLTETASPSYQEEVAH